MAFLGPWGSLFKYTSIRQSLVLIIPAPELATLSSFSRGSLEHASTVQLVRTGLRVVGSGWRVGLLDF